MTIGDGRRDGFAVERHHPDLCPGERDRSPLGGHGTHDDAGPGGRLRRSRSGRHGGEDS
jgi:hypothetical protein